KGELLVTAEATFRLATAEEWALESKDSGSRSWKPAALLALVPCLVLSVWLGKEFFHGSNESAKEIPATVLPEFAPRVSSPVGGSAVTVRPRIRSVSSAKIPESVAAARPSIQVAAAKPISGRQ